MAKPSLTQSPPNDNRIVFLQRTIKKTALLTVTLYEPGSRLVDWPVLLLQAIEELTTRDKFEDCLRQLFLMLGDRLAAGKWSER
jgi:hypothetical protein